MFSMHFSIIISILYICSNGKYNIVFPERLILSLLLIVTGWDNDPTDILKSTSLSSESLPVLFSRVLTKYLVKDCLSSVSWTRGDE